ncbi:exosome complex exonuclease exoribonuclease (Rrp44), putative [Talaromyces stipitatus ATCC 10500]|uniref:Chromosome disjunction protein 3 n=1 Tax=Talaromyces stipitatus (strain ATCC 10500 / CBS 375.48 / QM 6759 / NRRL 1006) TaxID=441959 RepID=B8LWG8_TALSN|nr:exosome complex exonuclease exoribonuclease (Rrp44), putative [Talaromyces stipitatus ATCC 10500]EED24279.1 exosome complex exonuclease exoribonuclease (Rrp44), putative [Talaromyces stipitatus ATCC 10500]
MKSLRRDFSSNPQAQNVSSKVFIRSTKSGKVQKIVRELYLRQDIPCSSQLCAICPTYAPADASGNIAPFVLSDRPAGTKAFPEGHYIVPDTNALLNGMDVFEHTGAFYDVIILQTVLEELRNLSLPLYNRLISLIKSDEKRFYLFFNEFRLETYVRRQNDESINDRNDRAVRTVANWYTEHLRQAVKKEKSIPAIVVLTDDKENLRKAKEENVVALSLADYVSNLEDSDTLIDMINDSREERGKRTEFFYPEYYTMSRMMTGVRAGTMHQGIFNVSPYNYLEGSVSVPAFDKPLLILGRDNSNRAISGDMVVVEILPKDQWKSPSSKIIDEEAVTKNENPDSEEAEVIVSEREKKALQEEVRKAHGQNAEGKAQPTARVVGIVKRNWRQYVGHVDPSSTLSQGNSGRRQQSVFVLPMDKRIPKIRIRTRQAAELLGQRILVTVDSWDRDSRYPTGHFVRSLGELETKGAETEALLLEYDVQYRPFPKVVLDCLPPEGHNWRVPTNMDHPGWHKRRDLRDLLVCSIDPPGCQDIDDALHARLLPNGNYEVGVHIADVSNFVKPNNAMDLEASLRGTTVYLVDKRIDMLPMLLGTDLCSLKPYVERFAFSTIWEITPNGEVVSTDFTKSVIRSREAFSYEQAQLRIDDASQTDELTQSMRTLLHFSKILRQKRMDAGALNLASPEIRIETESELNDPLTDVKTKAHLATNSLVEEFMLLANITVASKIYSAFPQTALLRRHASPPPQNFEQLATQLQKKRGLNLDVSSSGALAASLDKCVDPKNPFFNTLVRILATRCMTSAEYFTAGAHAEVEFRHYGLASPIYTHFTSPIRRYADLIVHRQLAAAIGYTSAEGLSRRSQLEDVCKNINYRHRNAQFAGRASIEYYVGQALKARGEMMAKNKGNDKNLGVDEEGYIMRVFENGVVVFVPRFGIEGIVRLEDFMLPGEKILPNVHDPEQMREVAHRRDSEYDAEEYTLRVWDKSHPETERSLTVELFERVQVNVSSVKEKGGRGAGKRKVRMLILGKV